MTVSRHSSEIRKNRSQQIGSFGRLLPGGGSFWRDWVDFLAGGLLELDEIIMLQHRIQMVRSTSAMCVALAVSLVGCDDKRGGTSTGPSAAPSSLPSPVSPSAAPSLPPPPPANVSTKHARGRATPTCATQDCTTHAIVDDGCSDDGKCLSCVIACPSDIPSAR